MGVSGLSNIIHPHPGDLTPACALAATHGSSFFIQRHLDALSAASVVDAMALLLLLPAMLSAVNAFAE